MRTGADSRRRGGRLCARTRHVCYAMYGLLLTLPVGAVDRKADAPAFESRALLRLQQMADAYARLPSLSQRTEFYSETAPYLPPDSPFGAPKRPDSSPTDAKKIKRRKLERELRLYCTRPNLLRLELLDTSDRGKPITYQWVSDGKTFFTTIPDKNWYTRDKAPKILADFRRMERMNANSLEVLMLMGVNPFDKLKEQVDSVRMEGSETVRETQTDVVSLRVEREYTETEVRLSIGKEDSLLRRLVVITTPIPKPLAPGRIGDPLDELVDGPTQPVQPEEAPPPVDEVKDDTPALIDPTDRPPPPGTPFQNRTITENIILSLEPPPFDRFTFQIPERSLLYGLSDQPLNNTPWAPNLMKARKHLKGRKLRR